MTTRSGQLVVDLSALQSPGTRGRGIARYALGWCRALEQAAPGLVGRYLTDPDLPPLPGEAADLVETGKVRARDSAEALPSSARAVHTFSLLDLEVSLAQCWPEGPGWDGLARSVTVFDCIPALDPATELADPLDRRRYTARFDLLRAADTLLVCSLAVRRDLAGLLGGGAERIHLVGAAPDARMRPAASRREARQAAVGALEELRGPFVCYPSGSHPRKNNELLVRAFARLPQRLLDGLQLVVTGSMPVSMSRHYHVVAERLGIRDHLVLAGDVPDDVLLLLLQGAELVCFPSLAEGYGLPVAEAIACGTPVIASDRPPLDELLGPAQRFDPTTPGSIAVAIARALGAAPAQVNALAGWDDVAERSLEALRHLARPAVAPGPAAELAPATPAAVAAAPRRRRAAPRPRVAVVSPFPPAPSGVAAYSYRLVEELHATGAVELELFGDGPTPGQYGPAGLAVHAASTLILSEQLGGRFDHVVYALGNSHHHLGALAALRRRPGVVIAHDVRLNNLYVAEHGDLPHGLRTLPEALRLLYGPAIPEDVGAGNVFRSGEQERFGLLLAREAIACSRRFLVSSRTAQRLARSDVPGVLEDRIEVLPFALEAPPVPPGDTRPETGALARLGPGPLVASYGIVDPAKQPQLLLEAFAQLARRHPDARLAIVGPSSEELRAELEALAAQLGISTAVQLTGSVPAREFRALVERTTVAVQLRAQLNGEASAAAGQCLACGVATIVSDRGWMGELPGGAVAKLGRGAGPDELAELIGGLLADEGRRRRMRDAALELAGRQGFAATAAALLGELSRDGDRGRRPEAASA